jgi:hypothetical protein
MAKKNKGGRPKERVSDKVDFRQVAMLCEKGFTDKEIGAFYGVSEVTINNWKSDQEFSLALKKGKKIADQKVVKALFQRATGYETNVDKIFQYEGKPVVVPTIEKYPPDPTSIIFWLKNRVPDDWREKQEIQHSGEIKTITETTQFTLKRRG